MSENDLSEIIRRLRTVDGETAEDARIIFDETKRLEVVAARIAELEKQLEWMTGERDYCKAMIVRDAKDWSDDDTQIRELAKPFGIDVEGDSYCVPGMVDVVEAMAKQLAEVTAERDMAMAYCECRRTYLHYQFKMSEGDYDEGDLKRCLHSVLRKHGWKGEMIDVFNEGLCTAALSPPPPAGKGG